MKTKTITSTILALLVLISLTSLVSALTISSVTSTPSEIAPGQTSNIKLTVENEIGEDLENVQVSLDLANVPFAPFESSTQRTIDSLDDRDEEKVNFDLIALANADAGTYKIPVIISYDTVKETSYISLIINSKPELKLDAEGNLIKGMNDKISIKITNSGLSQVKLLSISIKTTTGLNVLGSSQVYIGNIDSNDFDSADFDVFISATSPSIISLPVELTYKDATNKDYKENQNLILKTYTQQEAINLGLIQKSNTLTYIVAIVVLIILYLIYRAIRKRRKKKALEESRAKNSGM